MSLVLVMMCLGFCLVFGWYGGAIKYLQFQNWTGMGNIYFMLDKVSWWFLFYLMVIVFSVYQFSEYYLSDMKFLSWLGGFTLSMVLLVLGGSSDLYSFLIGWDWLGLTSFYLIFYYSGSVMSGYSSVKTYIYNRMGDGLFVMMMGAFLGSHFFSLHTVELGVVFGVVFFFACGTKSAFFPFSSWLPYAMAAPTPVSALVHSSTLVTAGLYILLRSNLDPSPLWLLVGGLTFGLGGYSSYAENDSKKAVAYSTLSQLGLMLIIYYFLASPELLLVYILGHAVMKAGLFMSVGFQLNSMSHAQDFRFIRSKGANPSVDFLFIFSSLSLAGLPFTFCFLFKDQMLGSGVFSSIFLVILGFFLISMSEIYSLRLLWGLYSEIGSAVSYQNRHSYNFFLFLPLYFIMYMGVGCLYYSVYAKVGFWFFFLIFNVWYFSWVYSNKKQVNSFVKSSYLQHHASVALFWEFGEVLSVQEEMLFTSAPVSGLDYKSLGFVVSYMAFSFLLLGLMY